MASASGSRAGQRKQRVMSSQVPLGAPSAASLAVVPSSVFQGWEACKNATGLSLSHVTVVWCELCSSFLPSSQPDVDLQRAHLALEIIYLARARGRGF